MGGKGGLGLVWAWAGEGTALHHTSGHVDEVAPGALVHLDVAQLDVVLVALERELAVLAALETHDRLAVPLALLRQAQRHAAATSSARSLCSLCSRPCACAQTALPVQTSRSPTALEQCTSKATSDFTALHTYCKRAIYCAERNALCAAHNYCILSQVNSRHITKEYSTFEMQ